MSGLLTIPEIRGEVETSTLYKQLYATDASVYRELPRGVFFPKDADDVQIIVEWASRTGQALIPRTAGTSLAGQCVGDGWVVDVSKHMNRIEPVDVENRTVWVDPGVIRDELNRYLHSHGLWFSPNTSTSNRCMIGGMVGNNSSGSTSIKYGVTRDKVVRIEGYASDGSWMEFGPLSPDEWTRKSEQNNLEGRIYKHILNQYSNTELQDKIRDQYPDRTLHRRNNGYAIDGLIEQAPFTNNGPPLNLSKLLAGSEGTLFFSTRIQLQLDPLPPSESALICPHFRSIRASMEAVVPVMAHQPDACELMDRVVLDCTRENRTYTSHRAFVEGEPEAVLMVEIRAETPEELNIRINRVKQALQAETEAYALPVLRGENMRNAWELRKAGLGLLSNVKGDAKPVACIEDTAVEIDQLPAYIAEFEALMQSFNQQAVYYAHAGAGELHLRPILNLKTPAGVQAFRQISEASARLVKSYRGSLAGEHGVGRVRGEFLRPFIGEEMYGLLEEMKRIWDPRGIFNPGKIVDTPPMEQSLRYEVGRNEPDPTTFLSFRGDGGILRHIERCNGTALCRKTQWEGGTMCPSYMATFDEKDSTRGRANVLRELFTSTEVPQKDGKISRVFDTEAAVEALDLCLSCKACQSECPSNIDMAKLKAETLHLHYQQHRRPLRDYFFGQYARFAAFAAPLAPLVNRFQRGVTGNLLKQALGIASERNLPRFAKPVRWKSHYIPENSAHEVVLYIDEFTNAESPQLVQAALQVLTTLGYTVHVPPSSPSARPELSKGFLTRARRLAHRNIDLLFPFVERGWSVVGLEPSAILGFTDEYPQLVDPDYRERAEALAQKCLTFESFLWGEWSAGRWNDEAFDAVHRDILLHTHCHQKALGVHTHTAQLLAIPRGHSVRELDAGCCGMAGSFGYEKEHYSISMSIANQRLLPALRSAEEHVVIVAPGTSCRHQIADGVHKKSLHPVEVLRMALKTP